ARRGAPEVEAARIEVDVGRRAVVLERAQVAQVAAQTEVLVEESHHAKAGVPAEVVARRADREKNPTVNLRANEAETGGDVRSDAAAMRAADRNADDQVAHHVDDAVGAEIRAGPKEARAVSEVDLAAEYAAAHRAGGDAEARAAVVEDVAALESRTAVCCHPRTDVAVRACLGWCPDDRDRCQYHTSLQCTSHVFFLLGNRSAREAPAFCHAALRVQATYPPRGSNGG